MSSQAVVMLVVGLVLVWGGLGVSIGWAVHVHRRNSRASNEYGPDGLQ